MSRCVTCGSKGDCDEFCGLSFSEMRDSVIKAREEIEKLQSENEKLNTNLTLKNNALENETRNRRHYVDKCVLLQAENEQLKEELKRENISHNYHCKESQRKNDVIDKLQRKLDLAVEALGFYGNWANSCGGCFEKSDTEVIDVHNPLAHDVNGVVIGGKRARQALAQIRGEG